MAENTSCNQPGLQWLQYLMKWNKNDVLSLNPGHKLIHGCYLCMLYTAKLLGPQWWLSDSIGPTIPIITFVVVFTCVQWACVFTADWTVWCIIFTENLPSDGRHSHCNSLSNYTVRCSCWSRHNMSETHHYHNWERVTYWNGILQNWITRWH